jgi:hypothetical protein
MKLIGVSGKKQSGKDATGKIIQYFTGVNTHIPFHEWENSEYSKYNDYEIHKFADKLKDIICLLIGCTREQLENDDFKNTELNEEWWKIKLRDITEQNSLIPYVGNLVVPYVGYKGNISNISEIFKPTPRYLLQFIGSELFRFNLHENTWVNATMADYNEHSKWIITDTRFPNEAEAIKSRGGILIRVNRNTGNIDNHVSEISLDDYKGFDYIIDNNGTFDELIEMIKEILIFEKII